ncbi:ferredoxin [Streptosporangium nondiastaticum]|uniref:Ferredoxin n=3 Tax=Actinomycetes TaxID=1760 RepID=A0A9X7PFS2_9ACTN|nr:ferredoxin [Streptomyces sp. VNUA116]PSJ26258.1 ferredoxin [Streptosporangium nondiastaticum]WKU49134.1 ferredoxin [Streptomyces sp. VNUA116]
MRITIDRDRCIGSGQCVMTAPGVFTQDDDALVALVPGHEDGSGDPRVLDVPMACPVQAIEISEG